MKLRKTDLATTYPPVEAKWSSGDHPFWKCAQCGQQLSQHTLSDTKHPDHDKSLVFLNFERHPQTKHVFRPKRGAVRAWPNQAARRKAGQEWTENYADAPDVNEHDSMAQIMRDITLNNYPPGTYHDKESRYVLVVEKAELPVLVDCPQCGRCSKISCVKGSRNAAP